MGQHPVCANAGQHPYTAGRRDRARVEHGLAHGHILAGEPHVVAGLDADLYDHPVIVAHRTPGALHHHDCVSARRHRRARHDPGRLSGGDLDLAGVARGNCSHHLEVDGSSRGVGRPEREAVHGGVCESGHSFGRRHRFGEHQAKRLIDRNGPSGQGRDPIEHVALGLGQRDHVLRPTVSARFRATTARYCRGGATP